jgi:hypothetical protein
LPGFRKHENKNQDKEMSHLEEKERHLTFEYFDNSITSGRKLISSNPNDSETKESLEERISQKKAL